MRPAGWKRPLKNVSGRAASQGESDGDKIAGATHGLGSLLDEASGGRFDAVGDHPDGAVRGQSCAFHPSVDVTAVIAGKIEAAVWFN